MGEEVSSRFNVMNQKLLKSLNFRRDDERKCSEQHLGAKLVITMFTFLGISYIFSALFRAFAKLKY